MHTTGTKPRARGLAVPEQERLQRLQRIGWELVLIMYAFAASFVFCLIVLAVAP